MHTLDLFADVQCEPAAPDWKQERDAGIKQALDHAERDEPGFGERAYEFLVKFAAENERFSGEDATDAIKAAGIIPACDKAFGAVYQRALRANLIHRVAFGQRRKGHGSLCAIYAGVK
jgi:hypothetical protein